MKLAGPHIDIEPHVEPGKVHGHAGGTHVGSVVGLVFHPLDDPYLTR